MSDIGFAGLLAHLVTIGMIAAAVGFVVIALVIAALVARRERGAFARVAPVALLAPAPQLALALVLHLVNDGPDGPHAELADGIALAGTLPALAAGIAIILLWIRRLGAARVRRAS